jgi:hypothetical protein
VHWLVVKQNLTGNGSDHGQCQCVVMARALLR